MVLFNSYSIVIHQQTAGVASWAALSCSEDTPTGFAKERRSRATEGLAATEIIYLLDNSVLLSHDSLAFCENV